jgi:hypothetical protein
MPLRRVAQIAVVLGLVAVGVWVVRGKKWELLRKPTEVAAKPAPAIKPRGARNRARRSYNRPLPVAKRRPSHAESHAAAPLT